MPAIADRRAIPCSERRIILERPATPSASRFLGHRSTSRYARTVAVEAVEQRAADERVADRHLVEMRQLAERDQVLVVEVMAGVDAEPELVRRLGGDGAGRACAASPASGPASNAAGERLGEQLDAIGAQLGRPPDRGRVRVDEHADADAGRAQAGDGPAQRLQIGVSIGQPPWLVTSPATTGTSVH